MSCESQTRYADFHVFGLENRIGARFQSGAGGYHVIDDEHVPAFEKSGVGEGELVVHVFPAAETGFLRLGLGEFGPHQDIGTHNFWKMHGHALRNLLALVVAAFLELFGMQRNRHKIIDIVETVRFGEGFSQLAAHEDGEFLVVPVLYAVQNLLHSALFRK